MDRTTPFDEIQRLFDQINRQFEEFEPQSGLGGGVAVDVADTGEQFEVTADMPGYESDDIDVTLPDPQTLRISATSETTTETESDEEDRRYIRQERSRQSMSRTVPLPEPVEDAEATASHENGVLTVSLPKQLTDDGSDIPVR